MWLFAFEHLADRADAAVHHVRRRDDIHARFSLRARLLDEDLARFVVLHVAFFVEHAILAVARVRIERDVRQHAEHREVLLQLAHGARNETFGIRGFAAIRSLERRLDRRKQRQHRHAQFHALLGDFHQQIDGRALDAGHRRHGLPHIRAFDDEHRINEVVGREEVFAHQTAREVIAAHPARAMVGIEAHVLTRIWSGLPGTVENGLRNA